MRYINLRFTYLFTYLLFTFMHKYTVKLPIDANPAFIGVPAFMWSENYVVRLRLLHWGRLYRFRPTRTKTRQIEIPTERNPNRTKSRQNEYSKYCALLWFKCKGSKTSVQLLMNAFLPRLFKAQQINYTRGCYRHLSDWCVLKALTNCLQLILF